MMPEELSIELKYRILKELINLNLHEKIKKIDY